MYNRRETVFVIGIGNQYRSDDAAGLIAAGRIRKLDLPDVEVTESDGDGISLMDLWFKKKNVIIIDAVYSASSPGTLHILTAGKNIDPPDGFRFSTHSFGILQALKLSETLSILPENILIYGIEGADFAYGQGLSSSVKNAIDNIVSLIHKEILELQSIMKEKSINGPNY
jgi:hydrogenase maturation protease